MASAFFRDSDLLFLRAPIRIATGTPSKSHTGVIAGGVIGGVAALLAIGVIALVVVWRRWRQSHGRTSVGSSFLREATDQGTQVTLSPFTTGLAPTEAVPLAAGLVHSLVFPGRLTAPIATCGVFPCWFVEQGACAAPLKRITFPTHGQTAIQSPFNCQPWQGCGGCGHIFIRSSETSIRKQLFGA